MLCCCFRFTSSATISVEELRRHPGEDRLTQALVNHMQQCCHLLLQDQNIKFMGEYRNSPYSAGTVEFGRKREARF